MPVTMNTKIAFISRQLFLVGVWVRKLSVDKMKRVILKMKILTDIIYSPGEYSYHKCLLFKSKDLIMNYLSHTIIC